MDLILFGGVILAFVLSVGLVAAATRGPQAPGHLRVVGTVLLLAVAAFCVFGFFTSFELPAVPLTCIGYAVFGIASLVGAAGLATYQTGSIESSS
jgi:heme A synthase